MTLQTMPVDTTRLEFRYHGASEFFEYDRVTEKRSKDQARDADTGFPIYTVRCQVLYRNQRQSGMIAIRVPLPEPPSEDMEFEQAVAFTDVDARTWNMDGRDGQTWTATAMSLIKAGGTQAPPTPSTQRAKTTDKAA